MQKSNKPRFENPTIYTKTTVTDWLATVFLCVIPVVNVVMLVYWAFIADNRNIRKNFARAYLVVIPFSLILAVSLAAIIIKLFGADILGMFMGISQPMAY